MIIVGVLALAAWAIRQPADQSMVTAPASSTITTASLVPLPVPSGTPASPPPPPPAPAEEPGRPGGAVTDQLRPLGSAAEIDGRSATVLAAEFVDSTRPFQRGPSLLLLVKIANVSSANQNYGLFDWQLQFPDGHVEMVGFNMRDDRLGVGSLVRGGEVTGTIVFDVGTVTGDFYLLFGEGLPVPGQTSGYGVWKVTRT
jgi:hypothetical protein